jgi:pimeloyl-ACP methyl ester carboxylesterase
VPFVDVDGVRLYYRASGRGTQPMVFVHGYMGDTSHWDAQAREFGRDHRVIRVDLRGHGRSAKPQGDYSIETLAEDTANVIRALDLPPVVLVGHSMGGGVTLRLAVEHPELVRGLVLLDASISSDAKRRMRERGGRSVWAVGPDGRPHQFHPDFDPAVVKRVLDRARQTPYHVRDQAAPNVFKHDIDEAVRRLAVPTLYVASHASPGRDPALAFTTLEGTGAWVGAVVGAGHFVMIEAPDQLHPMMRRFLVSLQSPPPASARES